MADTVKRLRRCVGCLVPFVIVGAITYSRPGSEADITLVAPTATIVGAPLVTFQAQLVEVGGADTTLNDLRASCSCTVGVPSSVVLRRGTSDEFPVRLSLRAPSAPNAETVYYAMRISGSRSNGSPWLAETGIPVSWPVVCDPWELRVDGIRSAEPDDGVMLGEVLVKTSDVQPPEVLTTGHDWVWPVVSSAGPHQYKVMVCARNAGEIPDAFDFFLKVSVAAGSPTRVRIHGHKYPALEIVPLRFHFGLADSASDRQFTITLVNPASAPERTLRVVQNDDVRVITPIEPAITMRPGDRVDIQGTVFTRGTGHREESIAFHDIATQVSHLVSFSWYAEE